MSITLIAAKLGPSLLQYADKNLRDYIKGKVDQQVVGVVIERTQKQLDHMVQVIAKRTVLYLALIFLGLLPLTAALFFQVPKAYNWVVLVLIVGFITYMTVNYILAFNRMVNFVIEFDQKLLEALEAEFRKAKEENWKNKVALLYSGRDGKDYFHHVLSHIVIVTCSWLKDNKYHLYVRLAAYALAAFCLSMVVSTLLHQ